MMRIACWATQFILLSVWGHLIVLSNVAEPIYLQNVIHNNFYLTTSIANDSRKCLVTKICNVRYACMYLKCTCVYAYDCVCRDEIMWSRNCHNKLRSTDTSWAEIHITNTVILVDKSATNKCKRQCRAVLGNHTECRSPLLVTDACSPIYLLFPWNAVPSFLSVSELLQQFWAHLCYFLKIIATFHITTVSWKLCNYVLAIYTFVHA